MKPTSIMLACCLMLHCVAASQQNTPELQTPFVVKAGGQPIIAVTGHAAPLFHDLDKDGKKDLIVGEYGGGRARFYRNTGKPGHPAFGKFTYIKANGEHASVPSS